MRFEEYKAEFDGAPFDIEEFAEAATTLEDHEALKQAAERYLAALLDFHEALEESDVFFG